MVWGGDEGGVVSFSFFFFFLPFVALSGDLFSSGDLPAGRAGGRQGGEMGRACELLDNPSD